MATQGATRQDIAEFLSRKRLAVIGVSRNEKDYSRTLFRELVSRGYDAVPVNPSASEIEGRACFARLADVSPAVEGALVLLPPTEAARVVQECVGGGVKRLWLRHDVPGARELCDERGISLISGYCPFMFLPNGAFVHKCHGFAMRLVGGYPS